MFRKCNSGGEQSCKTRLRDVPAKSNVRFVERAKRVIEEYGKQAATPDEARELLNLNIQVYLFRKNGGVHRWTPPFFGPT